MRGAAKVSGSSPDSGSFAKELDVNDGDEDVHDGDERCGGDGTLIGEFVSYNSLA